MKLNEVKVDFFLFHHASFGIQIHKLILNINQRMVEAKFDLQLAIAHTQAIETELSR